MEDGIIKTTVASFQNVERIALEDAVMEWAVSNNVEPKSEWRILANPAGDWSVGGFDADTGLTGRKIAIDSYGPRVPIGGGEAAQAYAVSVKQIADKL